MSKTLIWLGDNLDFPEPELAFREPNGLLAAGGDLSPARLLKAYQLGIFPWYEDGQPLLWWSPDPRMVLFPAEVHVSSSMKRLLRKQSFKITSDQAFAKVIQLCAQPRSYSSGTWITDEMTEAYCTLHKMGHAHSIEIWQDEQLVGGLYGIALGKVFFGESMFSLVPNASKVALISLARTLADKGFRLIDCQVSNSHLASLGAREIPRTEFIRLLPSPTEIKNDNDWCWPLQ